MDPKEPLAQLAEAIGHKAERQADEILKELEAQIVHLIETKAPGLLSSDHGVARSTFQKVLRDTFHLYREDFVQSLIRRTVDSLLTMPRQGEGSGPP